MTLIKILNMILKKLNTAAGSESVPSKPVQKYMLISVAETSVQTAYPLHQKIHKHTGHARDKMLTQAVVNML